MANVKLKDAVLKIADKMIEIINHLENNKNKYNNLVDNSDITGFLSGKQLSTSILSDSGQFGPSISLRKFTQDYKDRIEKLGSGAQFLGQISVPSTADDDEIQRQLVLSALQKKVGDYIEVRKESLTPGEFIYSMWEIEEVSGIAASKWRKVPNYGGTFSIVGAGVDAYSRTDMSNTFANEEDLWIDDSVFSNFHDSIYSLDENYFSGEFSTLTNETSFNNITTNVNQSAFESENVIKLISLPKAVTIGSNSFKAAPLLSLSIPSASTIGDNSFQSAKIKFLDSWNIISIGAHAFANSPLTELKVPKATTIGDGAFSSIVNSLDTVALLDGKFNTDAEKNRIFGTGKWDKISFVWRNSTTGALSSDKNSYTLASGLFNTVPTQEGEIRLKSLGENIFRSDLMRGTSGLIALVTCKFDEVKYVPESCFSRISSLTSVTLNNALYIGHNAFEETSLTTGSFGKCKFIGDRAFQLSSSVLNASFKLHKNFKEPGELKRIFGNFPLNRVTVTYVDDNGNTVT